MQQLLDDQILPDYLYKRGIFPSKQALHIEPAGDGNINWVRRATSLDDPGQSWIVKQARPALERFPEYRAPTERLLFEARYMEVARPYDGEGLLPRVRDLDAENRVLVLEDFGDAERMDHALARGAELGGVGERLAGLLGRVHRATAGEALAAHFPNHAMQQLHGDHIFRLPFEPNDFPLPPATAQRARELRSEDALLEAARSAYRRYLEPRGALLHGDVQATNVLLPDSGVKLLDAEIAHVGDPAFDLGILLAHLALPAIARGEGERARPSLLRTWEAYQAAFGAGAPPQAAAVARYAGLELLRRTLGAARVPAVAEDVPGLRVIDVGLSWVREPGPPSALALESPASAGS